VVENRKSLKVLKVEVKVILACFGPISFQLVFNNNRERSERRKKCEKLAF